jgi:hypothetical protein
MVEITGKIAPSKENVSIARFVSAAADGTLIGLLNKQRPEGFGLILAYTCSVLPAA